MARTTIEGTVTGEFEAKSNGFHTIKDARSGGILGRYDGPAVVIAPEDRGDPDTRRIKVWVQKRHNPHLLTINGVVVYFEGTIFRSLLETRINTNQVHRIIAGPPARLVREQPGVGPLSLDPPEPTPASKLYHFNEFSRAWFNAASSANQGSFWQIQHYAYSREEWEQKLAALTDAEHACNAFGLVDLIIRRNVRAGIGAYKKFATDDAPVCPVFIVGRGDLPEVGIVSWEDGRWTLEPDNSYLKAHPRQGLAVFP